MTASLCCLDLLLWSWYKYHTFSWTGFRLKNSDPKMRTLETEIKRGGVFLNIKTVAGKGSNFMLGSRFLAPTACTCPSGQHLGDREVYRQRPYETEQLWTFKRSLV